jgi:hypothetical protein
MESKMRRIKKGDKVKHKYNFKSKSCPEFEKFGIVVNMRKNHPFDRDLYVVTVQFDDFIVKHLEEGLEIVS